MPLAGAHPARGNVGEEEQVEEVRIEVMCPAELAAQVAAAARAAHSYEQPAIDVMLLDAPAEAVSLGVIGNLPLGPWLKKRLGGGWLEFSSFAGAAALFVLCLLAAAGSSFQPFIYAQF